MFSDYSELMCCMQAWLALTPYSPCGSVFLLILYYSMIVSAPQPTLQMTKHASEQPPDPSNTHALENDHSKEQAPAHQHDKEANDGRTDAEKPTYNCVWALDFLHRGSTNNLNLLPDRCLSSLLKHAVSNLPHALLSSLLNNMCSRVPCPRFEASKFLPYLRSPMPVYRYPIPQLAPVWDTGTLRTFAFWIGMEPTVRFVWTIPTVDLPSKRLFSEQVRVIVHGKERELCVYTALSNDKHKVNIVVLYNAGQNRKCQDCELNVQFAVIPILMHDQTVDATERSLGAGIHLPGSMLLKNPSQSDLNGWRDPVPKCYHSIMGNVADLVKFTQLVVCATIRFVASEAS